MFFPIPPHPTPAKHTWESPEEKDLLGSYNQLYVPHVSMYTAYTGNGTTAHLMEACTPLVVLLDPQSCAEGSHTSLPLLAMVLTLL